MKYIVYATSDNGNGYVMKVGEYDSIEEIEIRVNMFALDVVLSIEEEKEE